MWLTPENLEETKTSVVENITMVCFIHTVDYCRTKVRTECDGPLVNTAWAPPQQSACCLQTARLSPYLCIGILFAALKMTGSPIQAAIKY